MKDETRIFYVVDSMPSNEELFETQEAAMGFYGQLVRGGEEAPRLRVAKVRHAYYEPEYKAWNYDDLSDTFETVKVLEEA